MGQGYFKVKSIKNLDEISLEERFDESDFAVVSPGGKFVQLEYVEDKEDVKPYEVTPGIWTIQKSIQGLFLQKTEYVEDKILESFVHTKEISEKIDCFFSRLEIYAKHGIEVPTRKMLLFGPPGTGKTTSISKVVRSYAKDGKTGVIIWPTDKFEAHAVKDFVQSFVYTGVERLILIIEDIGGVEIDQVRMRSDSSLLSLLDNQEKTFKIPSLLIATTNHPEIFLGNLTNRPGRFDDKIEVDFPRAQFRKELFMFFAQVNATPPSEESVNLMLSNETTEFSAAHIKEVFIRADIYMKPIDVVIKEMIQEIKYFNKAFSKRKEMGISFSNDDD